MSNQKFFNLKFNKILLSAFVLIFLFGLVFDVLAASPQFNVCPGDKETLRLKNRTQGDTQWYDPVSANAGNAIGFDVYYHNCATGTTAVNTKVKIEFPTTFTNQIITTGYLWADNASTVSDTGTINVTSAQKLIFEDTAKWYPNQISTNPTILPVTKTSSSVQVNIGNIAGNWTYQGHVVFEAVLSTTNNSPTANAGPDKEIREEESITLNGSGSDPDSDPITYSWSCTGGSLSNYYIAQPLYTALSVSSDTYYTCTLTVTDDEGLSDSDNMKVLVKNEEEPTLSVYLSASPSSGRAPLNNVDLTAQVSGTATGSITYKFDCTNNGTWEKTTTRTGSSYTVYDLCDYSSAGTYIAKVEVERAGLTAQDTAEINVSAQSNNSPTANAGSNKEVWERSSIILNGSGYDPDGEYLTYYWSCSRGSLSSYYIAQPVYTAPSVSYDTYYTCTLRVTDSKGLSDSDSMQVLVRNEGSYSSTLSVYLSASPSSGQAPLNNVDLTAQVSGSDSGFITYRFDCTSSGSWEKISTRSSSSYTVYDLCDYSSAGTYIAKVEVERAGLTAQDTATINVSSARFSINKSVRNVSRDTDWYDYYVSANPGETVSFSIKIKNTGSTTTRDVYIEDNLPAKISYSGNLKIDGDSSTKSIISGFNIGDLSPYEEKEITFDALVASKDNFSYGITELINTALARNNDFSDSDTVKVKVTKTAVAGATTVVTGTDLPFYASIIFAFIVSLIFYLFFYYFENSQNPLIRKILGTCYKIKSFIVR